MQINTNISSLTTRNFLRSNSAELQGSMERLSSGKRINSAADDAAGLAISTRMTTQIRGKGVAIRNAQDGISMIQTAESALGSISNILQRMRELAVQADNGTNSDNDKSSLQSEMTQLSTEIQNIAAKTTFNGINLLNSAGTVDLHIGDGATDTMSVNVVDAQTAALGSYDFTNDAAEGDAGFATDEAQLDDVDVTDDASAIWGTGSALAAADQLSGAQAGIKIIDAALDEVSAKRAEFGAVQNRLEFTVDNLTTAKTNTEAARSRVLDADMAAETSNMTKAKVLSQSSIAMLSQANQNPQMVLQLLQG